MTAEAAKRMAKLAAELFPTLPAWVPGRRQTMCQARQILAGVGLDDVNGDGIERERMEKQEVLA